jgi:hypothetical protein
MGHAATDAERESAEDFLRWAGMHEGVIVKKVDEDNAEVGLEAACIHLTFDEEGKAGCSIYGEDRPEICKGFPSRPTPNCPGFHFVEDNEKVETVSNKEVYNG